MVTYSTTNWENFVGAGIEFFSVHDELSAPLGKHYFVHITGEAGDTYATGGITANAKRGGLSKIDIARPDGNWDYGYEYVMSSDKIKIYSNGSTELTNNTSLSGIKIILEMYGS